MSSDGPKRCLGCGYIIQNLPENRCPECGREFDPRDRRTYISRARVGTWYLLAAIISLAAPASVAALGMMLARRHLGASWLESLCGLMSAAALVMTLWVGDACIRAMQRPREQYRRRWAIALALLLCAAVWVTFIASLFLPARTTVYSAPPRPSGAGANSSSYETPSSCKSSQAGGVPRTVGAGLRAEPD